MRKITDILILLALVGFSACTRVENPEVEDKISYVVGRYASTKAEFAEFRAAEGLEQFHSMAFVHNRGEAAGSLYYESDVTWNGEIWDTDHDYFWPKHPATFVNFVSWYASAGITLTEVSETNFRVTREIAATDKLLVADEAWRQTSNTTTYYTAGVPTLFRHVLTEVALNMCVTTAEDASSRYSVVLQEVTLSGYYTTGSMSLHNEDPGVAGTKKWTSSGAMTLLWTPASGTNTTPLTILDSDKALTTTPSSVMALRSFLPQNLGDGVVLNILYTVENRKKSDNSLISSENDIPATVVLNTIKNTSSIAINQWVPNKRYTYTIAINPASQEILLEPTLETDWTFEDHINTTVE